MFKHRAVSSSLMLALIFASGHQLALLQTIEINGEVFRDPTQPPGAVFQPADAVSFEEVAPRISLSDFNLTFVRSGGISPVAVINDQTLTEGDEINGVVVTEIRPAAVVLSIEGEEQVLNLFSRSIRQTVE